MMSALRLVPRSPHAILLLLLALLTMQTWAIPAKVGNRMIPRWWLNARTAPECETWRDCGHGECCARPMLAAKSYCLPRKAANQPCDASGLLVDIESEVFYGECPCERTLTCANIGSSSVCLDPELIEMNFRKQKGAYEVITE